MRKRESQIVGNEPTCRSPQRVIIMLTERLQSVICGGCGTIIIHEGPCHRIRQDGHALMEARKGNLDEC